jgi:7-cyano-7-deazaguanine synthase
MVYPYGGRSQFCEYLQLHAIDEPVLRALPDLSSVGKIVQRVILPGGMKMQAKPKAVVLLSGGLDSSTTLAIAKDEGFDVHALSFRYGQRHEAEIEAARRVAVHFRVAQHIVAEIDLRRFGGSALTGNLAVLKGRPLEEMSSGIPVTYVPARNTIFLSFALAWAEVLGAADIFLGVNSLDYSGYPDCRPEYIEAYQRMANLATKAGVEGKKLTIHAPLIRLSKAEIIRTGLGLGVDYTITITCYDPSLAGEACGRCDACALRLQGFAENGISDPACYVPEEHISV